MTDDAHLLRQYVDHRSEIAFAELVQRHLGMVYRAAARQLGDDSDLAPDVAQSVFVLLASKSRTLLAHPSLAAWLHTTTRLKVSEQRRAERRRRTREAAAHFMHELIPAETSARDWERLRPLIDEVLVELKESDREAVLLRYFEGQSFAAIAARLGLTETNAHKRVERALENLRRHLDRRGANSTAAALALALGSQAALAAPPAGLAAAVTGAVLASGFPTAAIWSVATFMSTKTTAVAATIALIAAGGLATHQVIAEREAAATLALLERDNAALAARGRVLEGRPPQATVPAPPSPGARPPAAPTPPSPVARALGSGGLASVEESQAFLRANPEVRDALAAYYRDSLGAEYADLLTALGLTASERERFLTLLANSMRRIVGEHQLSLAGTELTGAEITRQLRELLGETRYQQYREFRASAAQRSVTQELTRSLYFTPTPLTPAQASNLARVVAQALVDPALGPKYTGGAWPYLPLPVWDRIIADARATLAEAQIEALRELQQRSQFFHDQTAASKAYRASQAAGKPPGK